MRGSYPNNPGVASNPHLTPGERKRRRRRRKRGKKGKKPPSSTHLFASLCFPLPFLPPSAFAAECEGRERERRVLEEKDKKFKESLRVFLPFPFFPLPFFFGRERAPFLFFLVGSTFAKKRRETPSKRKKGGQKGTARRWLEKPELRGLEHVALRQ
jgi:hypothetical protein